MEDDFVWGHSKEIDKYMECEFDKACKRLYTVEWENERNIDQIRKAKAKRQVCNVNRVYGELRRGEI